MPLYLTGLLTTDHWRFPPSPYHGRGWKLHLTSTRRSALVSELSHRSNDPPINWCGKEVAIEANNVDAARRAAFLLDAAACLSEAAVLPFGSKIELLEITQMDSTRVETTRRATRYSADIPLQCMIASRTSQRRSRSYALSKYWLSLRISSVLPIDLNPSYSSTIRRSTNPIDQVSLTTAIVLANSVIEELGLDVRASKERPSTINGSWNPRVKQELEERLERAGVNLEETFHWLIRGSKTSLESVRPARPICRSPWAQWDIRDAEVSLIDAIAHVGWLRSKVSAHRTNYHLAKGLSAYDVANAQHLARRLLLETLGFWYWSPDEAIETQIESRL